MFADIRGSEVMSFIKKQIGEATFCRKSNDQVKEKEGRRKNTTMSIITFFFYFGGFLQNTFYSFDGLLN